MVSVTTEIGKELRKLRIDEGETLGDMADKLTITASYLSAIEKGKRPVPKGFVDSIAKLYSLSSSKASKLTEAADKTIKSVKMNLSNSSDSKREAALCFARTFDDLDDDTAEKILGILKKDGD